MNCLAEETVQSFVQGELSEEEEASLHEHCATCPGCRGLIAEVARAVFEDTSEALSRGDAQHTVGRYVILEPIAEGGSSVVYAAADPDLGRKVALKLLRSGPSASGELARRRMLREGRAMALLSHPNVVTVYDVGTWRGQVFVAMELVVGETLKQWQSERKPTRRRVLEVYLAAGRGLAAAHAAGLVHRDFKPENVLVGVDSRVRVTDFGLARPAGTYVEQPADLQAGNADEATRRARTALATLTQTGAIVGTPAYMAPEQFAGKATDARTDQFSFCVALYEALYGCRPFAGNTLEELIQNIVRGDIPRPPDGADHDGLAPAILRGLDAAPERRHPSMDALLELLEQELSSPRRNVSVPPARRRAALAMAIALLGLASGATAAMFRTGAAFRSSSAEQPPEAASIRTDSPAMNEPAVEEPDVSDPAADARAATSANSREPTAATPQSSARPTRPPSRSVNRRHPTTTTSAQAPSRPFAASSTASHGPGSGAGEDGALITDPWRGP